MNGNHRVGAVVALVLAVVILLSGAYVLNGALSNTSTSNDSNNPGDVATPSSGGGSLTDQNGGGTNVAIDRQVSLEFKTATSNMAVGTSGYYEVTVYNLDGSVYTGDLILQVGGVPSGSQVVGPCRGDAPGLYVFGINFTQAGEFGLTVTPYDDNGTIIGNSIDVAIKVVPEGTIAMTGNGTLAVGDDQTLFYMVLQLFSNVNNAGSGFDVTSTVLEINGTTYERPGYDGLIFAKNNVAEVSVLLPNSAFPPGAPYTITVRVGDQVFTASGIAPN